MTDQQGEVPLQEDQAAARFLAASRFPKDEPRQSGEHTGLPETLVAKKTIVDAVVAVAALSEEHQAMLVMTSKLIGKAEQLESKQGVAREAGASIASQGLKNQQQPNADWKEYRAKIEEAVTKISAEKEAWINSRKVGYLTMNERNGLFSKRKPQRRFVILRIDKKKLEIYVPSNSSNSTGLEGEPKGKPKSVWTFLGDLTCTPINVSDNPLGPYVLELRVAKYGQPLRLGCESDRERQEWVDGFSRSAKGFTPSASAEFALNDAMALRVIRLGDISPSAQEQLVKIDSLVAQGLLTEYERIEVTAIIIKQEERNERALKHHEDEQ